MRNFLIQNAFGLLLFWSQLFRLVCVYEKLFIVDGRATKTRQKRDKNENCLVYFIKRRQAEASRATPCVLLYLCEPHVSGSLCVCICIRICILAAADSLKMAIMRIQMIMTMKTMIKMEHTTHWLPRKMTTNPKQNQ